MKNPLRPLVEWQVMKNDMVCRMTEGELAVVQNKKEFTVKKGDV
jgi:hypothetical protein